uniref:Uncharacterized protein n=1 Tax=Nothoprocta perdicaria TaxID=30464 RepID=A0A8C6YJ39_NOTPE
MEEYEDERTVWRILHSVNGICKSLRATGILFEEGRVRIFQEAYWEPLPKMYCGCWHERRNKTENKQRKNKLANSWLWVVFLQMRSRSSLSLTEIPQWKNE